MKVEINLYQAPLWPVTPLYKRPIFRAVTLSLLLLVGILIAMVWQVQKAESLAAAAVARRDQVLAEVSELQGRSVRRASGVLAGQADELEAGTARQRQLLAILSGQGSATKTGFAAHLEGLARASGEGHRITSMSIGDGGHRLSLSGQLKTPELLPVLLRGLAAQPAWHSARFEVAELLRSDRQAIEFHLRTLRGTP